MSWYQLLVYTQSEQQAHHVSDVLTHLGALAVTHSDALNEEIFEPPLNTMPLWSNTVCTALFNNDIDKNALTLQLTNHCQHCQTLRYHWETIADQAWERVCMQDFHPMHFGNDLWICPSWTAPPHLNARNIILDPGLAFGTGTHPTTRLCLEWISSQSLQNQTVIDYGTGSGILAIAAVLCGAHSVWAVDIDPQAITATIDNRNRNNINADRLIPVLVNACPDVKVDLVMANILAGPLQTLAPILTALLKPGGRLIMSGILVTQLQNVQDAYQDHIEFDPPQNLAEWGFLSGVKKHSL